MGFSLLFINFLKLIFRLWYGIHNQKKKQRKKGFSETFFLALGIIQVQDL